QKQAAGAATGIEDPALVGRKHLDQHADHAAGRVELAALLALGAGKLREEVFVDAAQDVLAAILLVAHRDRADQVNQFAQALLIQSGPRVFFRQDTLQLLVVALDGKHGVVDELADSWLLGRRLKLRPSRLLWDPE